MISSSKAMQYGIPQARHRVIIVGVREDYDENRLGMLKEKLAADGSGNDLRPAAGPEAACRERMTTMRPLGQKR